MAEISDKTTTAAATSSAAPTTTKKRPAPGLTFKRYLHQGRRLALRRARVGAPHSRRSPTPRAA